MTVRAARRKIPSAQVRRTMSPRLPIEAENLLALEARKLVAGYMRAILPIALAAVSDFARDETERTDAADRKGPSTSGVSSHMRTVARRALAKGIPQFEARSKQAAERVQRQSKAEFGRLKLIVKKEPELRPLIDGWRKDNIARIKGLSDEHVMRLEAVLANGFASSPLVVSNQLKEIGNMSDKRADLIARDQVLTLNAQINRRRQVAAGVDSFIWVTQNDERVREEHAEIDGETFTWEDGHPEEEFPGVPIQCRCVAFPIKPETSPDDEEPEQEEPED